MISHSQVSGKMLRSFRGTAPTVVKFSLVPAYVTELYPNWTPGKPIPYNTADPLEKGSFPLS